MQPPPTPADSVTTTTVQHTRTPISDDHDEKFGVPTLHELGKWESVIKCLFVLHTSSAWREIYPVGGLGRFPKLWSLWSCTALCANYS